ncbi:MAG: hypothetical protein IJ325_09845 [Clostridia bacterium]|nr:hypothetical protein [Clostridia bacterium]
MTTTYSLNNRTPYDVAMMVRNYLEMTEKMETQEFVMTDGSVVIQARAIGGSFKQWVGLDKTITVTLTNVNNTYLNVEIGSGKWADKGIAMTVSMFVLWPLAVTSGIGMYKQGTLPAKINTVISQSLR